MERGPAGCTLNPTVQRVGRTVFWKPEVEFWKKTRNGKILPKIVCWQQSIQPRQNRHFCCPHFPWINGENKALFTSTKTSCHITIRDYTTIKKNAVKNTTTFIYTCCGKEPQGSRSPVLRAQFTLQRAMLPHHPHLKSGSFWDCQQKNGVIPTESTTKSITIQIFCAECMRSSPGPSAFGWSKAPTWLISNCSWVLLTQSC